MYHTVLTITYIVKTNLQSVQPLMMAMYNESFFFFFGLSLQIHHMGEQKVSVYTQIDLSS